MKNGIFNGDLDANVLLIFSTAVTGYDPTENRPNVGEWLKLVRKLTNPVYDEAHSIIYKLREQEKEKL